MKKALLLLLAVGASAVPSDRPNADSKCGYHSCTRPKPDALNVHIVPHTHDDVGWLKTVDQYYYGSKNDIQKAGVQYILDSVVNELWKNPDRRFIYVETAFFWKWWELQTTDVQQKVHTLVQNGRLKFVGGAWSMNDEANTYYQTTIDQFTWGLSKLNATFGECGRPRVGWQIDPFGHSRELASMLAGMGYDGLFLGRIDYQDKIKRLREKRMEMVWRGDDSLRHPSDIFTCAMYNTYSPPPGFCFDVLCQDEPIIDDPESPDYNVDRRVSQFLNISRHMAEGYATNNLIVTMGEDFQYQAAEMWFNNLDKLVKERSDVYYHVKNPRPPYNFYTYKNLFCVQEFLNYTQQMSAGYRSNNVIVTMGGDFTYMQAGMWFENMDKLIQYGNLKAAHDGLDIHLLYSTPDCYLRAVHESNPTLPTKQDDFFPYASDPHAFWTGYFTSRPTVKYLEAQTNVILQAMKQLLVLVHLPDMGVDPFKVLDELRSVMGVMQHHDAVTGTEKQHVANDYVRMVSRALHASDGVFGTAFNKMMNTATGSFGSLEFERCQFNESSCFTSENAKGSIIVGVYNPLAWEVTTPVSIPVAWGDYQCYDEKGNNIVVQMMNISDAVKKIPTRVSKATKEATFIAKLPALGHKTFYLLLTEEKKRDARSIKYKPLDIEDYFNRIKQSYSDINNFNDNSKKINDNDEKVFENADLDNNVIHFIPLEPNNEEYERKVNPDTKARFLLKTKDVDDKNVQEFGKIFESTEGPKRSRYIDNPYSNMGGDEMRMLGDDPMVVTRYPDDEMADQSQTYDTQKSCQSCLNPIYAEIRYYPGRIGNNAEFENRSSGAYIFRPNSLEPYEIDVLDTEQITGELFDETRKTLAKNVAYAERKYKDFNYSEIDWIIGPIPIDDDVGKEFVIKYSSCYMMTRDAFYTDSNGRQMLKRILNKRPQWNLTLEEIVSGNYYPITAAISVKDPERNCTMTVLPDRAVGGSSMEEGSIEVMVHRRLLHDDAFGVGEALNETVNGIGLVVRGTHRVFQSTDPSFKDVLENRLKPLVFVADAKNMDYYSWRSFTNEHSWLKSPLPEGVHLLTLEPWGKSILLRLENYLEDTKTVNLNRIVKNIEVRSFKETYLAADRFHDDNKWSWNVEREFADDFNKEYGGEERPRARKHEKERDNGFDIKLRGKQIRTFIINYERKNS